MKKEERIKKLEEITKRLKSYDLDSGKIVLGIDEAGRGPLAGPVVIAGVIMKKDSEIVGVRDSKKITENQRNKLYNEILNEAMYYEIEIIEPDVIDEINILNATKRGTENIIKKLEDKAEIVFLDALNNLDTGSLNYRSIVKGDDTSYSIACASIIAKVTRDNLMQGYSYIYPEYGFDKHKGYGTKKHYEAIFENGITKIHRKSFLKNLNEHNKRWGGYEYSWNNW